MSLYRLMQSHCESRSSVYESGEAKITWVPMDGYPDFETRLDAQKAFLRDCLYPVENVSDEYIRSRFKPYQVNMKMVKVIKI